MPCPDDDLDKKAEEIADEVVDEIEEEIEEPPAEPEPESESEEEEPEPAKPEVEVYKTTVETMGGDATALDLLLEKAGGKPLVLDFQYDACEHCQAIAPVYEEMMYAYQGEDALNPKVNFYKVDIFQHKDRLEGWGITKSPTF